MGTMQCHRIVPGFFFALAIAGARQATDPPAGNRQQGQAAVNPTPGAAGQNKENLPGGNARTIKVRVNVVPVKVVVRNEKGEVVRNLKREDFQIYDQGKTQFISTFGIETQETQRRKAEEIWKTQTGGAPAAVEKGSMPQRFVALLFDDVHLERGDVLQVRAASAKLIDGLRAGDRIGIFSTSGQMREEFTSDKEILKKQLKALMARPVVGKLNATSTCPEVTYYMADQYINHGDQDVLTTARVEELACNFKDDPKLAGAAGGAAESLLRQQLAAGNADNEASYRQMDALLREMAKRPGERVVILVSPGFLLASLYSEENTVIERATRGGVVINALDVRGLFSPESAANDISKPVSDTAVTRIYKAGYRTAEMIEKDSVLRDMAESTGGTFFHNSNDLAGGLQQLGGAPEVSYLLGFSPEDQTMDGKYHLLKVALPGHKDYEIAARHGYYAAKKLKDPDEAAIQEVQDAVYSQNEIQDMPLAIRTKYVKNSDGTAQLTVISHLGVKDVAFRKADEKNCDKLSVTTAIFDDNGEYVSGEQKFLDLQLTDDKYALVSRYGLQIQTDFALKAGSYTVREVIRESEGAQMAAKTGAVVIP